MSLKEMSLGQARKYVEAGKMPPEQIAGTEGWPDDVRLAITVSVELGEEVEASKPTAPTVSAPTVQPEGEKPKRGRRPRVVNQEEGTPPAPPAVDPTPEPPSPSPVESESTDPA